MISETESQKRIEQIAKQSRQVSVLQTNLEISKRKLQELEKFFFSQKNK